MIRRRDFLTWLAGTTLATSLSPRSLSAQSKDARAGAAERPAKMSAQDAAVTLFLCGDVMTGRGIDQILPYQNEPQIHEPYLRDARDYIVLAERVNGPIPRAVPWDYVWGDALSELARVSPDARIVNLETAITTHDAYRPKGINYRMHPGNVDVLKAAAIDCCSLANNHVLDWGATGLADTLVALRRAGIRSAGAGHDLEQAQAPGIIPLTGKGRVLVFAFGNEYSGVGRDWAATHSRPGVDLLPDLSDATVDSVAERVRHAKRPGDVAVASIHWGGNWGYGIPLAQRRFAHGLIDRAGIDVVHGHSSHHVKGIEVYQERPIIYGCGDFLSDYEGIRNHEEFRPDLGLMYFPTLDATSGRLLDFRFTPTRIRRFRIQYATRQESDWLKNVLNRECGPLGTAVRRATDRWVGMRLDWSLN